MSDAARTISIRPATGSDVAQVLAFIRELAVYERLEHQVVATEADLVTALFGLGTGLGAIALLTHIVDTPNFSSELAAMIGLGVGIDYALFILTRFREAYATWHMAGGGPPVTTKWVTVTRSDMIKFETAKQ